MFLWKLWRMAWVCGPLPIHVQDKDEFLGSWLSSGPALAISAIWGAWTGEYRSSFSLISLNLIFSLSLSFFQTNILKKNTKRAEFTKIFKKVAFPTYIVCGCVCTCIYNPLLVFDWCVCVSSILSNRKGHSIILTAFSNLSNSVPSLNNILLSYFLPNTRTLFTAFVQTKCVIYSMVHIFFTFTNLTMLVYFSYSTIDFQLVN